MGADDERSARVIEWTGERCVPWADAVPTVYEHLHRYRFAASFVRGKRVLELASGEGYGSAILAATAESVVAIEVDADAVAHSRQTYELANLEFVQGSMLELDAYPDGVFDVTVCFEAIEHVGEHRELIEGIARVTGPDGLLVLSTPDRDAYNAMLHEPNPFHVQELNRSELLDLLRPHFPHVALWGQTSVTGSRLLPLEPAPGESATEETLIASQGDEWVAQTAETPTYLVAVASRVTAPIGARSYLLDPTGELLRRRDARIQELKEENRALHARNVGLHEETLLRTFRRIAGRMKGRIRGS